VTVLALLVAFICAGQSAPLRSTAELQVKKLKANDVELAYVEDGQGDTVVFVHGGGLGDWRSWEVLRPFIAAKYRFVSLSRRYHHPNTWTDDGQNYTMAQHVADVAAFIRGLDVGKVHLVGNSYGGGVVARVALQYPELLRSVAFGEGLIEPVTAEGKAAASAAEANTARLRAAAEAGDLRQAAILQYDGAVGEKGAFEKLPLERQQQFLYNARTIAVELRSRAATIPLTCEQLRTLKVPALLVRGERTGPYPRHRYEATIACLPQTAEATIIPGAPHSWQMGNPNASAKAILAFIGKH
jgi:esterase